MSSPQLKLIANGYPSAKLDLRLTDESLLLPSLKILGSLLNKVEIGKYYGDLTEGWNACSNLREIYGLRNCSISDIRGLMKCPKPLLKCIQISIREKDHMGKCLNLNAKRTGALEEINLQCSPPTTGAFDKIVRRNKSLSSVEDCIILKKHILNLRQL